MKIMKIFVGLGNPGEKYKNTRHNVGFMVVDKIAEIKKLRNWKLREKINAEIIKTEDLILVKPQTFMNSSGETVKKIPQYLNIPISQYPNNLYIIHDDLDIPLGEYKIQFGRSAAGHHGVESIIKELGTQEFWRVRIGIRQPRPEDDRPLAEASSSQNLISGEDFVLQQFSQEEKGILNSVLEEVVQKLIYVT